MKQVEKTTGKKPKKLAELTPLPDELVYIWQMFIDLFNATGGEITYQEILAYSNLVGDVSPFEIRCIMMIKNIGKES